MTAPARRAALALSALLALALAPACASPRPYDKPQLPAPQMWDIADGWKPAAPSDRIPRGTWWTIFKDDALTALEAQAVSSNATLAGAAARFRQARALTQQALAPTLPSIDATAGLTESRTSTASGVTTTGPTISLLPSASYEMDLFGKRLANIDAARAGETGAEDDLENVRLAITSDLAANYFTLRRLDAEIGVVTESIALLEKQLALIRARHDGGLVSGLDLAQQQTVLETTRTQLALLRDQRSGLEHAIAVLAGQPAAGFRVAAAQMTRTVPPVALETPSELLERRPDIASAERAVAVANAKVGIARSAFFPSLVLATSGGLKASAFSKILDAPSWIWSLGAAAAQNLFDNGAKQARQQFADAGYDAAVADYRAVTLKAFREVQDALSTLGAVDQARASQAAAVAAAERALAIATSRYNAGASSALDLVSSQQAVLTARRTAVQLDGSRLTTTVALIKALGGGWQ